MAVLRTLLLARLVCWAGACLLLLLRRLPRQVWASWWAVLLLLLLLRWASARLWLLVGLLLLLRWVALLRSRRFCGAA